MRPIAILALAACGSTTPTPTSATSSPATTSPASGRRYWCYAVNTDQLGMCFDQEVACRAARAGFASSADPKEQVSECAAQPHAACFAQAGAQKCHPAMAMCRNHADAARHDGHTVGDCASTDPAASADPHWWCVSFDGGRIGSCARSRSGCEQDRAKAIELSGGKAVAACTGQANAQCFDGKHGMMCHPTSETCQGSLAYSKKNGDTTDASCRTAD